MLKKLEFLPKEHLIRKYSQISGKELPKVEKIVEQEGIETVADLIEEHLIRQGMRKGAYH